MTRSPLETRDDHPGDPVAAVVDAMANLPEAQRRSVILAYHGGLSCTVIATMTATTSPAVKQLLHDAVHVLHTAVRREPGAGSPPTA